MMNCMNILINNYGFVVREDGSFWWGIGSLVWGRIMECRNIGKNRYEVVFRKWMYDECGDCVQDIREKSEMFGHEMLTKAFENFCYDRYYKR